MRTILAEAAAVGAATARTITYKSRSKESQIFSTGSWGTAFVGGSYEFLHNGARLLDPYASFFFVATGITPQCRWRRSAFGLSMPARTSTPRVARSTVARTS
jgi:hypothetical protein